MEDLGLSSSTVSVFSDEEEPRDDIQALRAKKRDLLKVINTKTRKHSDEALARLVEELGRAKDESSRLKAQLITQTADYKAEVDSLRKNCSYDMKDFVNIVGKARKANLKQDSSLILDNVCFQINKYIGERDLAEKKVSNKNSELLSQNSQLKASLIELKEKLGQLVNEKNVRIESLESEKAALFDEFQTMKSNFESHQNDFLEVRLSKNRSDLLQQRISSLSSDLQEANEKLQAINFEVKSKNTQMKQLSSHNKQIADKLHKLTLQQGRDASALMKTRAELKNNSDTCSQLINDLKTLELKHKALMEKYLRKKEKVLGYARKMTACAQDAKVSESKSIIGLKKRIMARNFKIKEYTKGLHQSQIQINDLENKLTASHNLVVRLQAKLDEKDKDKSLLESQNNHHELQRLKRNMSLAAADRQTIVGAFGEKDRIISSLRQKLELSGHQVSTLKREISKLVEGRHELIQNLNGKLEALQAQHNMLLEQSTRTKSMHELRINEIADFHSSTER